MLGNVPWTVADRTRRALTGVAAGAGAVERRALRACAAQTLEAATLQEVEAILFFCKTRSRDVSVCARESSGLLWRGKSTWRRLGRLRTGDSTFSYGGVETRWTCGEL